MRIKKRLQITVSEVTFNILNERQKESGLSKSTLIELAVQEYFKDGIGGDSGKTKKDD